MLTRQAFREARVFGGRVEAQRLLAVSAERSGRRSTSNVARRTRLRVLPASNQTLLTRSQTCVASQPRSLVLLSRELSYLVLAVRHVDTDAVSIDR